MTAQINPLQTISHAATQVATNQSPPASSGDAFARILASVDGAAAPEASPSPSAMTTARFSTAEQVRKFGYAAGPEIIGQYHRTSIEHGGTLDNIAATGSYVIADVMKGETTLSQRIYDPNGRFVMAVNPRATGNNNLGKRDVIEELTELQQMRHGTWAQTQTAAEADFSERLAFQSNTSRAESDPASVNRGLLNAAAAVISAKSRVDGATVAEAMGAVPFKDEARDMVAIISANDPLQALKAATAEFYTSGIYRPAGEIPTNLSTVPTMTTSNGYKVAYVADNDHHAEAIAGRLFLTTDDGYLMRSLGTTPEQITKTLDTYGVGRVTTDPVSFMTDKPVHNHSVGTRASELNSAIAQALSSWAGFSNPYAGTSFLNARFMSNS
jgi:hypothetical protein